MMNDEARLLFSLWETVQEFIPMNDRQDAAAGVIRVLMDMGNDLDLMQDAEGECTYLDRALDQIAEEEADEDDDLLDEIEE